MSTAVASSWSGVSRKSPAGQMPATWVGSSDPRRLPLALASVSGDEVGGSNAPEAISGTIIAATPATTAPARIAAPFHPTRSTRSPPPASRAEPRATRAPRR